MIKLLQLQSSCSLFTEKAVNSMLFVGHKRNKCFALSSDFNQRIIDCQKLYLRGSRQSQSNN